MKTTRHILTLLCLAFAVSAISAKSLNIERIAEYPSLDSVASHPYDKPDDINPVVMFVNSHAVYIATEQQVPLVLLNVLGHVVGHDELMPGTYKLQLPEKGLYIVKAGTKIIRVTR